MANNPSFENFIVENELYLGLMFVKMYHITLAGEIAQLK